MDGIMICKCTSCNGNIRISEYRYKFGFNDKGRMIIKCNCGAVSYYPAKNPSESNVTEGGMKIGTWDSDSKTEAQFVTKFGDIPSLGQTLMVYGELNDHEPEFDFRTPHIYFCSGCAKEVETDAKNSLDTSIDNITVNFDSLMNYCLATDCSEDLLIEIGSSCSGCSKEFRSFWYYHLVLDGKPMDIDRCLLIGTDMPMQIKSGIRTKTECMKILEKNIVRWNAIFSTVLIATPFIGNGYLKGEQIIELWDWLKKVLDPAKAKLLTRTGTFKDYKKALEGTGISFDMLQDYGIANEVIVNIGRKQNFHAKVFVGYSDTHAEILSGSFNLVKGPSMENISLEKMNYADLKENYIEPMKIKIGEPEKTNDNWNYIGKNDSGKWTVKAIEISDFLPDILS